jgi:hypothetical protein
MSDALSEPDVNEAHRKLMGEMGMKLMFEDVLAASDAKMCCRQFAQKKSVQLAKVGL